MNGEAYVMGCFLMEGQALKNGLFQGIISLTGFDVKQWQQMRFSEEFRCHYRIIKI